MTVQYSIHHVSILSQTADIFVSSLPLLLSFLGLCCFNESAFFFVGARRMNMCVCVYTRRHVESTDSIHFSIHFLRVIAVDLLQIRRSNKLINIRESIVRYYWLRECSALNVGNVNLVVYWRWTLLHQIIIADFPHVFMSLYTSKLTPILTVPVFKKKVTILSLLNLYFWNL